MCIRDRGKEAYILFLLQLVKSYEELKLCSSQLEYFYSIVLQYGCFQDFDLYSSDFHFGFFYDIVLCDPLILSAIDIAYTGLCAHQSRTGQVIELIALLKKMMLEKCLFSEIWKKRLESLNGIPGLLKSLHRGLNSKGKESDCIGELEKTLPQCEADAAKRQELAKQKRRDKNRRKKQRKRLQKHSLNINDKEEIIDKWTYSIEAQLKTMELYFNQWHENYAKPNDEDLLLDLEQQQQMEAFIAKHQPLPKRLKPNISPQSIAKMEEVLSQIVGECSLQSERSID
eukprot:TRINITY_DN9724_c0_g1_i1.p1 TRINITY_DN9724_c0_g1~~TRINITY_DN9724_c0_g1_i1.p1  ORF type:complete len:285 (-),score=76.14 TRINITY_DN9724_c0_g1_i1:83-937(-)